MSVRAPLWSSFLSRVAPLAALTGALLASTPAFAADPPTPDEPPQAMIEALSRAANAVVGIKVSASEGSDSARSLGKTRGGSGVVIDDKGLILTIGYLLIEADTVEVLSAEGKKLPGRVVAYDQATGFGLVKPLLPMNVQPVPLGKTSDLKPGDALMAVTGGENGDVDMTRLVSKRPFSGYWEYHIDSALYTSPPLQSAGGNHSGAALFNERGELIGIGSLLVTNAAGSSMRLLGNMFVPVDLLRPVLAEMESTGGTKTSHRPWLGLTSSEQNGRIQVVRLSADSPAQKAGLQPGDLVLAVDGSKVSTLEDFYKKLWNRSDPEAEVKLTVLQGAELKDLTVKAQDRMKTLKAPSGV